MFKILSESNLQLEEIRQNKSNARIFRKELKSSMLLLPSLQQQMNSIDYTRIYSKLLKNKDPKFKSENVVK